MDKVNVGSLKLDLPIITWNQYFNSITRQKVGTTIESYDRLDGYGGNIPDLEMINNACYTRCAVIVEEMRNPSEVAKNQFEKQLTEAGVLELIHCSDFQDAAETAYVKAINNFSSLDSSVIINLGQGSYVLAPTSEDDIVLKLLDFTKGAIIIYRPNMYVRFNSEELKDESN